MALRQAGPAAKNATAYVTLEPCVHRGKTGPCVDELISAGIERCVVATKDVDPRVAGKGLIKLKSSGIKVDFGCLAEKANFSHRGFFKKVLDGRPRVTLKLALSLDGRIGTHKGESQWITGSLARRDVHALRAKHDAVLIGGGTARKDNPSLTVRGIGQRHQPVRIVVSKGLNFDGTSLKSTRSDAPLWLCHGSDSNEVKHWEKKSDKLLRVNHFEDGSLDYNSIKIKEKTYVKLKIYDFKLQELPILTKLLTLASLQGIADLLSGEGIRFNDFEMTYNSNKKLMTIEEIYALGPAISILMDGYIETGKLVSLRGTLVPATTINKAIGSIPLLGNILVGKKAGEGVFGVSFKIKGYPKDLKTTCLLYTSPSPRD